ncbi:response regulator [Cohnella endophytica]|uniref:Circadian input-output histidine kinase CikA n=1 Tax=Cohnella endophytica TaxID=2419778 RepID=A0A494XZQ9_9BACL|nr:response regulator [Cohnella endophytica]RKP53033.1 response regulator [Cohnella endophytica]
MDILVYFAQYSAVLVTFVFLMRRLYPFMSTRSPRMQSVINGIAYAAMGFVIMQMPLIISQGLHMDVRLISILLSGIFGGPLSGLITTVFLAGYRISLGGAIIFPVGAILTTYMISFTAYRLKRTHEKGLERNLWLLGLIVGVQTLAWALLAPPETQKLFYGDYALSFLLFHLLTTPLFYSLISFEYKRYETERKLKENEEKYRSLVENSPDLIYCCDLNGKLTQVNHQMTEFLRMRTDELIGLNITTLIPSEYDLNLWRQTLGEVLATKQSKSFEGDRFYPGSERQNYHYTLSPIFDQNGMIVEVMGTGHNVTKMKQQQKALMHYKEHLEDLVEERTTELANKNAQLAVAKETAESASRAKSEFLANMSHEIRTPLNAVIGMGHLLRQSELTEQQQDYVSKTMHSAENLLALVNNVLDFSKIEAKKMSIEAVEFDLYEVLNNVSNLIGYKAYDKQLRLRFSIHHEVPQMLVGDPLRLGQILTNLANNAVKFTDRGEIAIEATTVDDNKLLTDAQTGLMLRFSVTDSGIGMTKDQMDRLFREFTQADMSTTRQYGGTGLGLAISKSLAELMGGTIQAESQVGKGSRFTFTARFEVAAPYSRMNPGIPVNMPASRLDGNVWRPLRILLVCRDPEMRIVLKTQFEQFLFLVDLAATEGEAIGLILSNNRYELVVLEWKPTDPGMDKMIDDILGAHALPVPKLLLVSSYHEPVLPESSPNSAVDKTLFYPISHSLLYNEIVELFRHYFSERFRPVQPLTSAEPYAYLRQARILVVEDNEINQQVAKEILKQKASVVDVAGNGLAAIERIKHTSYDLILMDLQMPVMDGYEATWEIRKLDNASDIKIIAMTADAMKGVKEQVLAAGMDAYVTKPFDPVKLFGMLERILRQPAGSSLNRFDKGALEAGLLSFGGLPGLDTAGALKRLGNRTEIYREILAMFASKHSDAVELIRQAAVSEDRELVLSLTHTLSGVAANIGATELAEAAGQLQNIVRSGQTHDLANQLAHMEAKLRTVLLSIEHFDGA